MKLNFLMFFLFRCKRAVIQFVFEIVSLSDQNQFAIESMSNSTR